MKETYTIISVGVALALVIVVNGSIMRQDVRDLQMRAANIESRVSVIEGQLALLIEAWDIKKPSRSTVAGK